jgi:hypothetical protein
MQHDSIKTLLNSLERETGKRLTHSELARALNVSEQVITNWAKRGMSIEGALNAQFAFHRDANFILGRLPHPMMFPPSGTMGRPSPKVYEMRENVAQYGVPEPWPFCDVTVATWKKLDEGSRVLIEQVINKMAAA